MFARTVNTCWFTCKWCLLPLLLVALALIPWLLDHVDEEVRRQAEAMFAKHYAGLNVSLHAAQIIKGEGILLRGLTITEPGMRDGDGKLAYFEEIFATCDTSLAELASGLPDVQHVILRRPVIHSTRRVDGSWSVDQLLPLPKFGETPPTVVIQDASYELFDPLKNPTSSFVLRDIQLTLEPGPLVEAGGQKRTVFLVQGKLASDFIKQLSIKGEFHPSGKSWSLSGAFNSIEICPELLRSLPGDVTRGLSFMNSLRGLAQGTFQISPSSAVTKQVPAVKKGQIENLQFTVQGNFQRGRIDDTRLPYPITDIKGTFHADPAAFSLEDFTARAGSATLQASLQHRGYKSGSPLILTAAARRLVLDQALVNVLPDSARDEWFNFNPAGMIDADVRLRYDGQQWHPDVTVQCLNVAFTYHKFPYRLEQAKGTLRLVGDQLELKDVVCLADQDEVSLNGKMKNLSTDPTGWLEVRGQRLKISDRLLDSLPEKTCDILHGLHPRGAFDLYALYWRDPAPNNEQHKYIWLKFHDGEIRCDQFPYPLGKIRGVVQMEDDDWQFADLVGMNDSGRILCNGRMCPRSTDSRLELTFSGQRIPLDDELRRALSPSAQQLWDEMKPSGEVTLQTRFIYDPATRKTDFEVSAWPEGESVSITPKAFPYRLDAIGGEFHLKNGRADLPRLKARHDQTRLSAEGFCELLPSGGWRLHLQDLNVDRLMASDKVDRDLLMALPAGLRKTVIDLKPSGGLALQGSSIELVGTGVEGTLPSAHWDLRFECQQAAIRAGIDLSNINGGIRLYGGFDGKALGTRGELALDSLTYQDFQLTDVRGPLWVDNRQVLLGSAVPPLPSEKGPRELTGSLYGGTVHGAGRVALAPQVSYLLNASISRGSLARWASEAIHGQQKLSGEVQASVELRGTGPTIHDLRGQGTLQLRNADIYELPVMVSLLKILSVRPPDATAFTSSDIDFNIEGEHVYFRNVQFNGDAISLVSENQGVLNLLDRSLDISFHAVVGRDQIRIPLVRELGAFASQQVLEINVAGPLANPVVTNQALPGLTQTLQELKAGFQGQPASRMAPPAARRPQPAPPANRRQ